MHYHLLVCKTAMKFNAKYRKIINDTYTNNNAVKKIRYNLINTYSIVIVLVMSWYLILLIKCFEIFSERLY